MRRRHRRAARPAGRSASPSPTGSTPTPYPSPATTSSTAPRGCSPTTTASPRGPRSPSPRRSRSRAAWPAARPTRPPRWSRSTGSGTLHTSDDDLLALAARLGSDVPFALLGGTALGTGRGELVEPVPDPATWWWVAVPSPRGAVDAGGLPALRRAQPRRPGGTAGARRRPPRALDRRPRDPGRRAPQRPRDGRRSTCVPTSATCWSWASAAARCAAWCPARDPPASS